MVNAQQERTGSGGFGKEYANRNMMSPNEVDRLYVDNYGTSRTTLNKDFLEDVVEKNSKSLGVGCNIGDQLLLLQKKSYNDLRGSQM